MTARDVYRALWRRKFLILFLTGACLAATWYATSLATKTYDARTLVRVQARSSSGDAFAALEASQVLAQTYAEVVNSGALDDRVRATTAGLASSFELSASPVESLGLMWITASARSAGQAAQVANAVPRVLRSFVRASQGTEERVVAVKRATPPSSPASPNLPFNLAVAAILALIFNSGLALLVEALRDRLPSNEELRDSFGYPVLTVVPNLRLRAVSVEDRPSGNGVGGRAPEPRVGRTSSET